MKKATQRTAAIAVVGCTEDRDDIVILTPVVPLHHQLMRACYEAKPVVVVKLLGNVLQCMTTETPTRRQHGG
eukprot:3558456-Pyramimonas_sp.AAC.1